MFTLTTPTTIMMVTLRNCPPVILPEMLLLWSMPPLTQALQGTILYFSLNRTVCTFLF